MTAPVHLSKCLGCPTEVGDCNMLWRIRFSLRGESNLPAFCHHGSHLGTAQARPLLGELGLGQGLPPLKHHHAEIRGLIFSLAPAMFEHIAGGGAQPTNNHHHHQKKTAPTKTSNAHRMLVFFFSRQPLTRPSADKNADASSTENAYASSAENAYA